MSHPQPTRQTAIVAFAFLVGTLLVNQALAGPPRQSASRYRGSSRNTSAAYQQRTYGSRTSGLSQPSRHRANQSTSFGKAPTRTRPSVTTRPNLSHAGSRPSTGRPNNAFRPSRPVPSANHKPTARPSISSRPSVPNHKPLPGNARPTIRPIPGKRPLPSANSSYRPLPGVSPIRPGMRPFVRPSISGILPIRPGLSVLGGGKGPSNDPPQGGKGGGPNDDNDNGNVMLPKVVLANPPEDLMDDLEEHDLSELLQDADFEHELADPPDNLVAPQLVGDNGEDAADAGNGDPVDAGNGDPADPGNGDPADSGNGDPADPGNGVAGANIVINVPGLGAVVSVGNALGGWRPGIVRPGFGWGSGVWVPVPGYVPVAPSAVPAGVEAVVPSNALATPANELPANEEPIEPMTVVLLNPEENAQTVSVLLAGEELSLEAAQQIQFETPEATIVEFDRGGDFGTARYSLDEGVYEFKLTEQGWELYRKTFKVTLDNSANESDFNYLADGEPFTVAAGESRTHESGFPVTVSFDRGDGEEPAQVALPTGTYMIGVNPETELWDLFVAAEQE